MAVDAIKGQPRLEGYQETSITNGVGFPCITVDPSGSHVYLSTQVASGSTHSGAVAIYANNQSS